MTQPNPPRQEVMPNGMILIDAVPYWTQIVCDLYEQSGRIHTIPPPSVAKMRKLAWRFFIRSVVKGVL